MMMDVSCPHCGEKIEGSRQLIDSCPSCMKPWRQALFASNVKNGNGDPIQYIKEFVVNAFHKAQRDALWKNSGARLDTWHVSDFVSPCLRKSYYSKQPELKTGMTDEMAGILFQGVIVHDNSILSSINELTMCYDIVNKCNIDPSTVRSFDKEDPRKKDILTGTLDDLVKVGDDFVIVDKKTYNAKGYIKKEPNDEHKLQVNIYKLMLKAHLGIEAKYGCNLYLDKQDGYKETPLVYETAQIEETEKFLTDTLAIFKNGMPDPKITFLCNGRNKDKKIYCGYFEQCEKDGRDKFV